MQRTLQTEGKRAFALPTVLQLLSFGLALFTSSCLFLCKACPCKASLCNTELQSSALHMVHFGGVRRPLRLCTYSKEKSTGCAKRSTVPFGNINKVDRKALPKGTVLSLIAGLCVQSCVQRSPKELRIQYSALPSSAYIKYVKKLNDIY